MITKSIFSAVLLILFVVTGYSQINETFELGPNFLFPSSTGGLPHFAVKKTNAVMGSYCNFRFESNTSSNLLFELGITLNNASFISEVTDDVKNLIDYKYNIYSVQLPFYVGYQLFKNNSIYGHLSLGTYFQINFSGSIKMNYVNSSYGSSSHNLDIGQNSMYGFEKYDLGLIGLFVIQTKSKWSFSLCYLSGFMNQAPELESSTWKLYNRSFSINLGYTLYKFASSNYF